MDSHYEKVTPYLTISAQHKRKDIMGRDVITEDFKFGYLTKRSVLMNAKNGIGKAKVALSSTINVGNYESARIEVAVEFPFEGTDVEAAEEAAETARSIARKKLKEFAVGFEKSKAVQAHD